MPGVVAWAARPRHACRVLAVVVRGQLAELVALAVGRTARTMSAPRKRVSLTLRLSGCPYKGTGAETGQATPSTLSCSRIAPMRLARMSRMPSRISSALSTKRSTRRLMPTPPSVPDNLVGATVGGQEMLRLLDLGQKLVRFRQLVRRHHFTILFKQQQTCWRQPANDAPTTRGLTDLRGTTLSRPSVLALIRY